MNDPAKAVSVAHSLVGHGVYWLGTGDCDTPPDGRSDCFGFAFCRCYHVRRHRPGFNTGWRDADGRTPSVEDDLNSNSAIEDADHHRELFARAVRPEPGDLLVYPTIRLPGRKQPWIGHAAIIVGVTRALEFDLERPTWRLLDIVQCRGPDGRQPAITYSTGAVFDVHDQQWPKPEHRTALLRVRWKGAPAGD